MARPTKTETKSARRAPRRQETKTVTDKTKTDKTDNDKETETVTKTEIVTEIKSGWPALGEVAADVIAANYHGDKTDSDKRTGIAYGDYADAYGNLAYLAEKVGDYQARDLAAELVRPSNETDLTRRAICETVTHLAKIWRAADNYDMALANAAKTLSADKVAKLAKGDQGLLRDIKKAVWYPYRDKGDGYSANGQYITAVARLTKAADKVAAKVAKAKGGTDKDVMVSYLTAKGLSQDKIDQILALAETDNETAATE